MGIFKSIKKLIYNPKQDSYNEIPVLNEYIAPFFLTKWTDTPPVKVGDKVVVTKNWKHYFSENAVRNAQKDRGGYLIVDSVTNECRNSDNEKCSTCTGWGIGFKYTGMGITWCNINDNLIKLDVAIEKPKEFKLHDKI